MKNPDYCEHWFLMYKQDIGSFFGGFPSKIEQWFVMNHRLPMLFNSRQEAIQYMIEECLIDCTPVLWATFDSVLYEKRNNLIFSSNGG